MFYGSVAVAEAAGGILGHSLPVGDTRFRKGRLLSPGDIDALTKAGHETVYIARLGADDIPEDAAANRVAQAIAGEGARVAAAFTGRANLYADAAGVAIVDAARIEALNLLDEAVTVATIASHEAVEPGRMLATVKVIPFAAPRSAVEQAERLARDGAPLVRVMPFQARRAGLVMTRVPDTKPGVLQKTEAVVRERLARANSTLAETAICDHTEGAVAAAVAAQRSKGCDPILVFGGSAIVDRKDVVPAGIVAAGGTIVHFGMPVDPGNLLLLAAMGTAAVIGVPGCARSPKLNGFDWVLERICAGLPVGRAEIARMGAGGLLKEIPSRPMPRAAGDDPGSNPTAEAPRRPRIAALILAAGLSSRMGSGNKLLADLHGKPIIAHTVANVLASPARPVILVTGHMAEAVRAAAGPDPTFVHNPDFSTGLASSLRTGLAILPKRCDGVLVCLGDMPDVSPAVLDKLISAFNPVEGRAICVPMVGPKRGNPVLWGAQFFPELQNLNGDQGAKRLIEAHSEWVCEVPCADEAVLSDIDTEAALAARRNR